MIRAILQRVWPGDDSMPEAFRNWGEAWQTMHPDWQHICWLPGMLEGGCLTSTCTTRPKLTTRIDFLRFRSCLARLENLYRVFTPELRTKPAAHAPFQSWARVRCWRSPGNSHGWRLVQVYLKARAYPLFFGVIRGSS